VVKYTTIQETKGKSGNGTVLITCAHTIDHLVREINFTKDSIGLIGLSDERLQCNFPEDSFRWIFRNYLCEKDNLEYLLTNLQEHKSNIYWFPLGYNRNFDPYKSIIPMRNRKYLWSWAGSNTTLARNEFIKVVLNNQTMMQKGFLYIFSAYYDINMLNRDNYSELLYNSKFVPCPQGGNPEQFRIWEAIIAGAVPIVLKADTEGTGHGIEYIKYLKMHIPVIDTWKDVANFILKKDDLWIQRTAFKIKTKYHQILNEVKTTISRKLCEFHALRT